MVLRIGDRTVDYIVPSSSPTSALTSFGKTSTFASLDPDEVDGYLEGNIIMYVFFNHLIMTLKEINFIKLYKKSTKEKEDS